MRPSSTASGRDGKARGSRAALATGKPPARTAIEDARERGPCSQGQSEWAQSDSSGDVGGNPGVSGGPLKPRVQLASAGIPRRRPRWRTAGKEQESLAFGGTGSSGGRPRAPPRIPETAMMGGTYVRGWVPCVGGPRTGTTNGQAIRHDLPFAKPYGTIGARFEARNGAVHRGKLTGVLRSLPKVGHPLGAGGRAWGEFRPPGSTRTVEDGLWNLQRF